MGNLSFDQLFLLRRIDRGLSLTEIPEETRQRVIDLAMREPPLVDVDGELIVLTRAGRNVLVLADAEA